MSIHKEEGKARTALLIMSIKVLYKVIPNLGVFQFPATRLGYTCTGTSSLENPLQTQSHLSYMYMYEVLLVNIIPSDSTLTAHAHLTSEQSSHLISPCVLVDDSALRITARLHPLHGTMCVLVGMVERQTNPIGKLGFLVD